MSRKMVLLALGLLLFFAGEAYAGNSFIIELKNGNLIDANSCIVEGKKLVLCYPLGKAEIELGSVKRILISGPETEEGLFQMKGQAEYGHFLKQRDKSADAMPAYSEPVEIWNAGEKDREKARLIEKLAEAEANGEAQDESK
jgi:hypothetical protein